MDFVGLFVWSDFRLLAEALETFMHLYALLFVILVNFGNHYSDLAQKEEKIEIDCAFPLVSSSNWSSTSQFLRAPEHQEYPLRPSFGRLELPTPYHQGDGAVELSPDSLEVPLLSSTEQSGGHLLWPVRQALGRSFGWIISTCPTSEAPRTRTAFLHPVARRTALEFELLGRWPRILPVTSKLSISDTKRSETTEESKKEQREEGQGQGQVAVPGPTFARGSLELLKHTIGSCNFNSGLYASRIAIAYHRGSFEERDQLACRAPDPPPRECQGAVTRHDQGLAFSCVEARESQEDTAGCEGCKTESSQCLAFVSRSQRGQVAPVLPRLRNAGFGVGTAGSECHGSSQIGTRRIGGIQKGGQRDHRSGERWKIGDGCGGLGRGDTRSSRQQRPIAQRGHELHAAEPRVLEEQSRSISSGERQQKASHSCRRPWRLPALFAAGFCAARSIDQREIGYGLSSHGFVSPCVRKWTHSAVLESWFVSEWQASIDALDEAFALGFVEVPQPVPTRSRHHASKLCSFSDDIQLYFGLDDEIHAFSTSIKHEFLQCWPEKPWRRRTTRSTSERAADGDGQSSDSDSSSSSSISRSRSIQISPRGVPQIPWQQSIWEILQQEGRPEFDGDNAPVIFLSSYYLDHVRHRHHYQARPLRFSLDFDNWEDDIRFIWEDHIDPDLSVSVNLVQPSPPAITNSGSLGTLIVHQNPLEQQVACLISAVIISDPNTRVQEAAHSVAPLLTPERVLQLGGVDDLCSLREQTGTDVCSLHIGFRLIPRDQPIQIHDGLGITIRVPSPMSIAEDEHNLAIRVHHQQAQRPSHDWHGREQPENAHPSSDDAPNAQPEDVSSFMARSFINSRGTSMSSSSSSTSTLGLDETRRATVFCLDGRNVNIDAPWDDADRLWNVCARTLDIEESDIVRVLHVDFRPDDIAQEELECLLLLKRQEEPTVSFLRLCLQDVYYAADRRGPRTLISRKSVLIPHRSNRASIIRLAGFEGHCFHEPWRCRVWINGNLFTEEIAVLELSNGDYIRIDIPSHPEDPEELCAVPLDEAAESSRHTDNDSQHVTSLDSEEMSSMQIGIHPCGQQCKLDNTSIVEGPEFSVPLEAPEPPGRPELHLGEHLECMDALHRFWWLHSAVELEEEGRVLYVSTWYTDGTRWPSCEAARPVRLLSDPGLWVDHLAEAWDDRVDPDCPLHLYLITPQPRSDLWSPLGAPHVLIVQNPLPDHRSVHIATLDPLRAELGIPSCIRTVATALTRFGLLTAVDLQHVCLPGPVDCMVWWGEHEFRDGHIFPVRHGFSFLIIRNHLTAAASSSQSSHAAPAHDDAENEHDEAIALLQTKVDLKRTILQLDDLIPEEDTQPHGLTLPIRLIAGADMPPLPTYIECAYPGTDDQIQLELCHWGHQCAAHRFDQHDVALCLPTQWPVGSSGFHYMFSHSDVTDSQGVFLHSADHVMSDHEIMCFLYSLGYWRAVILSCDELNSRLRHVVFENVAVQIPDRARAEKPTPSWPAPMPVQIPATRPFALPALVAEDDCVIRYGISLHEIAAFFTSADNILQRDPEGYDFPSTTRAALRMSTSVSLADFDRIIIYSDGSSHALDKHKPALWNAEKGRPDTWAFVVLGECYAGSEGHSIEVLGWLAHEVHYEIDSPHHLGADSVGSHIAEREALTWACLWRLAHNVATPTLFRTDSQISALQATGQIGSSDHDSSFQCFRGAFQALETALPDEALQIEHIPGHTQEPFNDMVDWLAKTEREKSFYCQRQRLSMIVWRRILPHLWTFFSSNDGLPPRCTEGLHAKAPSLPVVSKNVLTREEHQQTTTQLVLRLTLSLCTANIASMYNGPWGHAGKTEYLRQQFLSMRLLFLGIQESRTPETFSAVENVLRIGSGHAPGGLYGVELWANLNVPYGRLGSHRELYFKRSDFQVLHRDPRTLLVRVETAFVHFALLVGYAPQSGLPLEERSAWWEMLHRVASMRVSDEPLFVFIDANADPGPCDFRHVLTPGFKQTANTELLREFLRAQDLCLPATSECHQGSVATWASPNGLHQNCIDHVCIPCERLDHCTFSSVLTDFDLGNGCFDHSAVAIQLEWKEWTHQRPPSSHGKSAKAYCRNSVTRGHVQTVLQAYVPAQWHQDVEQQVDDFNQHLLTGIADSCPRYFHKPKKAFISDPVWHLRLCKLERRKALKELEARRRFEVLHLCFSALTSAQLEEAIPAFWRYDTWLLCCKVKVFGALHQAAVQLRAQLKAAKTAHLQALFHALPPDAPASQILHELKQVIGSTNLRKTHQTALPFIRNDQGQVCGSPKEALDTWIHFFMVMEGGQRIGSDQQRREWIENLESFRASSLHMTLADLPSLSDLERAYRRVKPGKATGPDGVDALLCHLSPADFAKKTYSLMLKTFTHGQESLLHKGGRLHPLWKGKGAKDNCAAYRSILVSSHIGKTIHRCLRVHSADLFECYLQKQQLGGKRKISVATGVHQARAFLRSRRQRGLNVGMVFLDLCEAFYRIVRELAIGGPACDETIARMGHRLGMGDDLLHALYRHLHDDHALARAGFSQHMQMIVRSLHADTHFSLQGQEDRCKTRLGTRPGDSWADLIFSFLWARLLHDLEAEFQQAGLIDHVPDETGLRSHLLPCTTDQPQSSTMIGFLGPTWMDDSVFCFADPHADVLERKACHLCGLLLQKCKEFAMTPNLSPGKTAAMLVFQGPGSIATKKRIFGPSAPKKLTILTEYDAQQVHVVTTYTHLGCLLHHKGDMRQEARRRFSIAQTAFQQHRRLLYQNRHLSLRRRAELFRTLILAKFVYGCESWTLADARTRHFVHTSLIKLYKRLIHYAHEDHLTDAEVLNATGLPDPSTLLRMQRLRHLGALYATADSSAWGVINADIEWISLICSDLEWMWVQLRGSSDLPDPKRHFASWTYLMLHHRGYWKKLVLRAGAHAAAQRDNLFDVQCFHRNILSQLHDHGCLVLPPPKDIKQLPLEIFACMACEKRFPSRGGCGAHMFRSHGVFQTVRHLFDGTQCACCLKEFHSHGKLQGHLLRAEFCRRSLQRKGIHVAPVPGIGSHINGQLERAHDCVLPPLQAHGPQPAPGRRAEHDGYDLNLFEELYLVMLDATDNADCFQQLCTCIQGRVITWEKLLLTLRAVRDEATPADIEALPFSKDDFHSFLERLADPHTWPWLTQDEITFEGHWNRDVHDLAEYCSREADAAEAHRPPDHVPRGFGYERYFLHLFSGRRRKGDFQFFFDRLQDQSDGILIHIISLGRPFAANSTSFLEGRHPPAFCGRLDWWAAMRDVVTSAGALSAFSWTCPTSSSHGRVPLGEGSLAPS